MNRKYRPLIKKTFPVSLLLEEKHCLIVGAGPGILKKLENLIQSGAELTLVSPEMCEGVGDLYRKGCFHWEQRPFRSGDLEGKDLVYCGTSDSLLNREILQECRQKRILCCPIDSNWPEGDFTTPAIFRKDELSVSVSTGGASCRRSKLIKQSLAKHIEMIDSLELLVIGTSHLQLDISRREPFHLTGEKLEKTGMMLSHIWGVHEFLILNTCNRIEVLAVVSNDEAVSDLISRILGFETLKTGEYYLHRGEQAFFHSSELLAGLYSQTPGENHIVAQIKEAASLADEKGWSGTILNDWIARTLGISKLIRRETGPLLKEFEIEDVAWEYIRKTAGQPRKGMILGTGVIARGMARRLAARGIPLYCAYRNTIPEWEGAEKDLIEMISLSEFKEYIMEADFIIAATSSPDYLLDEKDSTLFSPERETLLIDLSLPRNISPGLGTLPGTGGRKTTVTDLDDLKHWYRRELADMERIMTLCRETIQENIDSYERIAESVQSRKP